MTRAKAAALGSNDVTEGVKKALQTKKSTATLSGANGTTRKRAALGDVSNVTKTELGATGKENGKKSTSAKAGSLSKAAQPTRVQKSRVTSTRQALGPKERVTNSSDLKRSAPGSGVGGATKKRITTSTKSVKGEDVEESENVAPVENVLLNVEITKTKLVEVKQTDIQVLEDPVEEPVEEPADLDKEDIDDPLMVSEYVVEIFEYLKELEINTMANPNYMDDQNELEWKMRGILVDWLLEVHTRFRLLPETLFLAVNIIDRFLSAKIVQLDRLQLVGVTAMFIASKYEEVLSPHVQNFRHVADDGFTEEEILSAERFVLAALKYDLSYPNPMNFLRRISKADNYDIQTRTLGKYLLEISCLDHRFIGHPPSQVAAAAMYLARLVLERGEWVSNSYFNHFFLG